MGIIHGFENSWGPFAVLDQDQPGLDHLRHLHRFFTTLVPFDRLAPSLLDVTGTDDRRGRLPLALATPERDIVVVYLPTGGDVSIRGLAGPPTVEWFDPRSGSLIEAGHTAAATYAPPQPPSGDKPDDWVLVLRLGEAHER
jgi:hypothetical protein